MSAEAAAEATKDAAAGIKDAAADKINDAKDAAADKINDIKGAAADKLGDLKDQDYEKWVEQQNAVSLINGTAFFIYGLVAFLCNKLPV